MSEAPLIPAAQRFRGQRAALLANIWMPSFNLIMMGPIMMLFANDVLGFNAKSIAAIIGLAPLLIVLRFPLLGIIKKVGLKRTLFLTDCTYVLTVLLLMFLPLAWLQASFFLGIVFAYQLAQVIGPMTVWQPLMRDVSTDKDRGRFFATMRFTFSVVTLAVSASMTFMIGEDISRAEYNTLLAVSLLGIANRIYWVRLIPERPHTPDSKNDGKSLLRIIRDSTLLKRPLFIILLTTVASMPMFVVYLRQCLHVPTNLVSAFIFMGTLGSVISMILWGRIADAIGFKPLLFGLILLSVLLTPALLLMAPIQATELSWTSLSGADVISIAVLLLYGLVTGAMAAGCGIASTSIQHAHTHSSYVLEEMALFSVVVVAAQSAAAFMSGWIIESWTLPSGSFTLFDGGLHWDWAKLYILFILNGFNIMALVLLRKLPNLRPHFGLADFFHSMFSQPLRTMYRGRFMYHENERLRVNAARLLAHNNNPLAIDPLLELVDDPSYDVRCEAISALAQSQSPTAGERLIHMLEDPARRQLWDRVAWALGELQFEKAGPIIQQRLQDSELAYRIRAMCARALGKINDRTAIPTLALILETDRESFHLRSSCCCALLNLKAIGCADLLFGEIEHMRDRYDRYELLALTCEFLDLDSRWLISAKSDMSTFDMLERHIQFKPLSWQAKYAEAIRLFHDKNYTRITQLIGQRLTQLAQRALQQGSGDRFEAEQQKQLEEQTMLAGLHRALQRAEGWGPNVTLTAAYLIYHWEEIA